jgi:hypothetical protein
MHARLFLHLTPLRAQAYRKNVPSINPEERIPISIDSESELPPPINFLKWVEQNKAPHRFFFFFFLSLSFSHASDSEPDVLQEGESIKPLFAKGEFKIDVVQVPENVPAVRYAGKMPGEARTFAIQFH